MADFDTSLSIEKNIFHQLSRAFAQAYPDFSDEQNFQLSHPQDVRHGDFASNIALVYAKKTVPAETPMMVAEKIAAHMSSTKEIEKIEIVPPGFINIFLHDDYLAGEAVAVIRDKGNYGRLTPSGYKIVFEYGQPNTHKAAHIGHLYSYCYGESCVRLLDYTGKSVIRANYQGDVGPHVAKCIWAYLKNNQTDPETLEAKVAYLQACYQQGSASYEEDAQAKEEIDQINHQIYDQDPAIMSVWHKTRQWSVEKYDQFEKRLGIHYDRHYFESETFAPGVEIVKKHIGTVFEQDGAAVVFRGEQFGLHTRVFINQRGNPTYEAKDIGLMQKKWDEYHFDQVIIETGNDQREYWNVVQVACEEVNDHLKGKIKHIHHGLINLSTGKMSSRSGAIITAESLVALVKERVLERLSENSQYDEATKDAIAEKVAIGAIKYSFLKSTAGKDITFDLESSITSEGNSGPYLQYAYARTQSIMRKYQATGKTLPTEFASQVWEEAERSILRSLYRFSEVVEHAATSFAPHELCSFLFELAQKYSYFYNQHQVITDNEEQTTNRLIITQAVGQLLATGLYLLGIEPLERV